MNWGGLPILRLITQHKRFDQVIYLVIMFNMYLSCGETAVIFDI